MDPDPLLIIMTFNSVSLQSSLANETQVDKQFVATISKVKATISTMRF